MSFIKNLFQEVIHNGKSMTAIIISQIPGITSVPGLGTAVKTAIVDRTPASYVDLAIQLLMLFGASLQAKKIVMNAADKS